MEWKISANGSIEELRLQEFLRDNGIYTHGYSPYDRSINVRDLTEGQKMQIERMTGCKIEHPPRF